MCWPKLACGCFIWALCVRAMSSSFTFLYMYNKTDKNIITTFVFVLAYVWIVSPYTCNCCIATRTAHSLQIISESILFKACEYCSRMSSSPNLVDLLCSIHYTYHQKHDEIDRFEELIATVPIIAKLEDKFTPHVVRICDAK